MSRGRKPQEREKYIIIIENRKVEVSPEVYHTYYKMERRERYQNELKQKFKVINSSDLTRNDLILLDIIPDSSRTTEEIVEEKLFLEYLSKSFNQEEFRLLKLLLIEKISVRNTAKILNMSASSVQYKKKKLIKRLKEILRLIE